MLTLSFCGNDKQYWITSIHPRDEEKIAFQETEVEVHALTIQSVHEQSKVNPKTPLGWSSKPGVDARRTQTGWNRFPPKTRLHCFAFRREGEGGS